MLPILLAFPASAQAAFNFQRSRSPHPRFASRRNKKKRPPPQKRPRTAQSGEPRGNAAESPGDVHFRSFPTWKGVDGAWLSWRSGTARFASPIGTGLFAPGVSIPGTAPTTVFLTENHGLPGQPP